jgi:hypothetical protein
VNSSENQVFQGSQGSAPFWQDKHAQMRVPVASGQPSPVAKTAREEKKHHSTKRQTVQAAGWIDHKTDLYIVNRLEQSRKLIDPKSTRSKVIAEMLKERAADDTFARSQAILTPLIQDVIRAEFRAFTNRFLWIIAKIAYQVGWILSLLLSDIRLRRDTRTMHQLETDSERDGRVYVAERSPQVEEVKERLLQKMEGLR